MSRQREPVDRVVDAIVAVPIACASAIRQLLPFGPTRVERLIVRKLPIIVEGLRAGRNNERGDVASARHVSSPAARTTAPVGIDRSPTTGDAAIDDAVDPAVDELPSLPIEGYNHLAARQIVDRLGSLSSDELGAIDAYERAHRRRQTVLHRIAQLK